MLYEVTFKVGRGLDRKRVEAQSLQVSGDYAYFAVKDDDGDPVTVAVVRRPVLIRRVDAIPGQAQT